jgi:hypothetical protein
MDERGTRDVEGGVRGWEFEVGSSELPRSQNASAYANPPSLKLKESGGRRPPLHGTPFFGDWLAASVRISSSYESPHQSKGRRKNAE